jgi:hypothetical protein
MNSQTKQRKKYKRFVFGETLKEAIDLLPESERGRFSLYVINYGIDGVEPELAGMEKVVWFQMKTLIGNLNNGIKEGAPYGNDYAKKGRGKPEPEQTSEPQPEPEPRAETTENNSNQLETTENKQNNSLDYVCVLDSKFKIKNSDSRAENFETAEISTGPPRQNDYEIIRAAWNSQKYGANLPECRYLAVNLDSRRSEILSAALATYPVGDIENAIKNYMWMRVNLDKVSVCLRFADMFNFLEKALPAFSKDGVFNETYLKTEKA